MTNRTALVSFVALSLIPTGVQAADVRVLAPTSDWTLDYADERCSLIREFGDGDETLRLQLDSYGSRFGYRVLISGDLVQAPTVVALTEIRVGYSPDTREREPFYTMAGKSGDDKAVSFLHGFLPDGRTLDPALIVPEPTPEQRREVDRLSEEFERSVAHMTIQFGSRRPVQLDTGRMAAPLAAMHQCVDDLIASWGIDPAQHWARTRPPVLRPETVREVQRNYPSAMAGRGQGAFVPARVMIDEEGEVTDCIVQVAVVDELFKRSVCAGLNGSYQPALDSQGQPVASFIQINTIYQVAPFR